MKSPNGGRSYSQLSDFTLEELSFARQLSPAIARSFELLKTTPPDFSGKIRQERHQHWLLAALSCLLNKQSSQIICEAWSQATDKILQQAWSEACGDHADLSLFALGKLGANELNLSSDVDLMVISRNPPDGDLDSRIRAFRKLLSEQTPWGQAYRIDFDLRPGGRFGPLITSLRQFEDYYWSQGEAWERLALVRLRPICGPADITKSCKDLAEKYSYRKFIDYTLFSDLKELRSKIHSLHAPEEGRINLKLSVGGIRDIELFVHSLQVIHGGKNPSLKQNSTAAALHQLKASAVLPASECDFLESTYWFYRDLENRIQAIDDQQVHDFIFESHQKIISADEKTQLLEAKTQVDATVSHLLGQVALKKSRLPEELEAQKSWISNLGFSDQSRDEILPKLLSATALSHKQDRDERARKEFIFEFVENLGKSSGDKDLGLSLLLDFLKSTRAKATMFSLFLAEPRLLKDLSQIFSLSSYLGGIIASRPELIDSFVYRSVSIEESQDSEKFLESLAERRMISEIIAANSFAKEFDVIGLTSNLSKSADEICTSLLHHLKSEFAPESKLYIMAMGKWGGYELGLRSDLDMILVTPDQPQENEFRLTKRLIARLTDSHRGGRIYPIDLRLRPSGKAGPLIISEARLRDYLENDSEAWERQSYLRARPVNSGDFSSIRHSLILKGLSDIDLIQLRNIRERLIKPSNQEGLIDLKFGTGGLVDIELCVQTCILNNKINLSGTSLLDQVQSLSVSLPSWKTDLPLILETYAILRQIEQLIVLMAERPESKYEAHSQIAQRISRIKQISAEKLRDQILDLMSQARGAIKRLDPIFTA